MLHLRLLGTLAVCATGPLLGGCCCEGAVDAEARRRLARQPHDDRIEVLLPPGLQDYARTDVQTTGYTWYPIPTYFRDKVTGLCFAGTHNGDYWSGLTQVSCGVVEGATARLLAAGWKPGEVPTP